MDIVKIVVIGLATVFASIIVKQTKPEISILINIAGGILLVLMVVDMLSDVFTNFYNIFQKPLHFEVAFCIKDIIFKYYEM